MSKEEIEKIQEKLQAETHHRMKLEQELAEYKANNNAAKWNELLNKRMDQIKGLEKELASAKQALSGRTISCSQCNKMAGELASLKAYAKDLITALELSVCLCNTCHGLNYGECQREKLLSDLRRKEIE